MRMLTKNELDECLKLHDLWLQGKEDGIRADLSNTDLRKHNLEGLRLQGADLTRASLQDANLMKTNLKRAGLWGADLNNANLRSANLENAILWDANLSGADLWEANLSEADLSGSDLTGASLRGASLLNARLRDAILSGADLRGADLSGCNLYNAVLCDVNLEGANLSLANLSFAIGNGREIVTFHGGLRFVNLTDDEVWINEHHHTWDQWLTFSDDEITKKVMTIGWWQRWKPGLDQFINERIAQRRLSNPPNLNQVKFLMADS